jgi:hypothetical protein
LLLAATRFKGRRRDSFDATRRFRARRRPIVNAQKSTICVCHIGGIAMLRIAGTAALLLLSTSAFAQRMDAVKGIKFGVGCVGPVNKFAAGLGTCTIAGTKARIFCPSGETFDRDGVPPESFVARSICNLNQVL